MIRFAQKKKVLSKKINNTFRGFENKKPGYYEITPVWCKYARYEIQRRYKISHICYTINPILIEGIIDMMADRLKRYTEWSVADLLQEKD